MTEPIKKTNGGVIGWLGLLIADIARSQFDYFVSVVIIGGFLLALALVPIFCIYAIRHGNHGAPVITAMILWVTIMPVVLVLAHRRQRVRYVVSLPCLAVILATGFLMQV